MLVWGAEGLAQGGQGASWDPCTSLSGCSLAPPMQGCKHARLHPLTGLLDCSLVVPVTVMLPKSHLLEQSLLEHDGAGDVLAQAGGGHQQLTVGAAAVLGVLQTDGLCAARGRQAMCELSGAPLWTCWQQSVHAAAAGVTAVPCAHAAARPLAAQHTCRRLPQVALDSSMARIPRPVEATLPCGHRRRAGRQRVSPKQQTQRRARPNSAIGNKLPM